METSSRYLLVLLAWPSLYFEVCFLLSFHVSCSHPSPSLAAPSSSSFFALVFFHIPHLRPSHGLSSAQSTPLPMRSQPVPAAFRACYLLVSFQPSFQIQWRFPLNIPHPPHTQSHCDLATHHPSQPYSKCLLCLLFPPFCWDWIK